MKLTQRQREFLDYMKALPKSDGLGDIGEHFGVTRQAVKSMVDTLERKGYIKIDKRLTDKRFPIMLCIKFKKTS